MTARIKKEEPKIEQSEETPEASDSSGTVSLTIPVSVSDFAASLGIKPNELIQKLMGLGVMAGINASLDDKDTITLIAHEFDKDVSFEEKKPSADELFIPKMKKKRKRTGKTEPRPPIVAFLGHVDHGKTSLLDQIRKAHVTDSESGGITQHIGAYEVDLPIGKITFIDTPGHAAFTKMRARGASVTDIVVLVIAADDGVMPQTEEAISHAQAADVPIIIAINKIDKEGINLDLLKKRLADKGLITEEWGGDVLCAEVSAKTGKGIDHLLELIILQSEIMELRAVKECEAEGVVIESKVSTGRGPVTTIIVNEGTLHQGEFLVSGSSCGKIKAMLNSNCNIITEAGPSKPVEILGFSNAPETGQEVHVIKDEKMAKSVAQKVSTETRDRLFAGSLRPVSLEDVYSQIEEGRMKSLQIIVKGDVRGSIEAIVDSINAIQTDEVNIKVIHEAVGDVSENDVMLAAASSGVIIAFNVRIKPEARALAKREVVDIRKYSIIYNMIDELRKAVEGMLEPTINEVVVGTAEIRTVFNISKVGNVAGCRVLTGKIFRSKKSRLVRDEEVLFEGSLSSLKRFKDEVKEVRDGYECGIKLDGYDDIKEEDIIQSIDVQQEKRKL